jgi:hypothetical protein
MKALRNHASRPAAAPLVADDVLEFHAGRLVLLIAICGGAAKVIDGLTKMAKLDFFVRYPDFFEATQRRGDQPSQVREQAVEAAMVRHHYGPWDKRYYHVLAFLEARGLITIKKNRNTTRIALTRLGKTAAERLGSAPSFASLLEQMQKVAEIYADKKGSELKNLIYATFDQEIGQRPLGSIIGARKS